MTKPKQPTVAFIDLDSFIFKAASTSEQQKYDYLDKDGKVVATFDSAADAKSWYEEVEAFEVDFTYGYEGDVEDLTRSDVYHEDKGEEYAKKQWESILKQLIKDLPDSVTEWKGFVSNESGKEVFRNDIATVKPYKGNRKDTYRPKHLEYVRSLALNHPNVQGVTGGIEVDDLVQAYAQKAKEDGLLVTIDKDGLTSVGCWVLLYDSMDEPIHSDISTVGKIYRDDKGKMKGCGYLFLLGQAITGDQIDNIQGVPRAGVAKAVELLSPFNDKPKKHLSDAIQVVLDLYKEKYGEIYEYRHCSTGELIQKSYIDVFKEMGSLLYMLRGKGDSFEKSIMKYYKENL